LKGPQGFNLQAQVCQGIDQPFEGMAAGRVLAQADQQTFQGLFGCLAAVVTGLGIELATAGKLSHG
jgi:hypothetical protein